MEKILLLHEHCIGFSIIKAVGEEKISTLNHQHALHEKFCGLNFHWWKQLAQNIYTLSIATIKKIMIDNTHNMYLHTSVIVSHFSAVTLRDWNCFSSRILTLLRTSSETPNISQVRASPGVQSAHVKVNEA